MTSSPPATDLEPDLLADVSVDLGWSLLERFSTLVRESGSDDERTAADYIVAQLQRLGIDHDVFEPDLYLSLPREGAVRVDGAPGVSFRAKPPSFAVSTDGEGVSAPAVYLPAPPMGDLGEIFEDKHQGEQVNVRGKIVVTNGYAMPAAVHRFERSGAVAQVYINPGERVHWGICTTIWGTPTHGNLDDNPRTPVVAVSHPDGDAIVGHLQRSDARLTVTAALDQGWYPCKLPVATIGGESDDYLLVHGHYDSWDVGIGDNAVGDATLLELARIFHRHRDRLRRTLKIAWWPGHSTGRYAGSTWYADRFALDLSKRCVGAINIDSPGCWGATAYEEVMWMAEADALCRGAIADRTGERAGSRRPIRAGDYSFNQIGLTSFYMLLSNIPQTQRDELGFYPVGGCGGNVAWHTEDDVMDVADRANLARDLEVYVATIARVLNANVLPLDFRATADELRDAVETYEREADGLLDLSPITNELAALRSDLDRLYARIDEESGLDAERCNETLKWLSRLLVPIGYARGPRFDHDPAMPLGPLPKLEDVSKLKSYAARLPERLPFLQAALTRRVNEVANALFEAGRAVRSVTG